MKIIIIIDRSSCVQEKRRDLWYNTAEELTAQLGPTMHLAYGEYLYTVSIHPSLAGEDVIWRESTRVKSPSQQYKAADQLRRGKSLCLSSQHFSSPLPTPTTKYLSVRRLPTTHVRRIAPAPPRFPGAASTERASLSPICSTQSEE
jgi:hypothetical protein